MEEFVLIMRHEFRADTVYEVVEFKGLPLLHGEGNSIEVRKFAKRDDLSRSCAIESIAGRLESKTLCIPGRCTV